jgi:hypothetical protein
LRRAGQGEFFCGKLHLGVVFLPDLLRCPAWRAKVGVQTPKQAQNMRFAMNLQTGEVEMERANFNMRQASRALIAAIVAQVAA